MTRLALVAALLFAACADREDPSQTAQQPPQDESGARPVDACDSAQARSLVQRLGTRLRSVSLLAPDSVLAIELRESYGSLVAPALLAAWLRNPAAAPGRRVSSPWPQRIEISEIGAGNGQCVVGGDIVHVANPDTATVVSREHVTITVSADGSRITGYEATTELTAAAVVRHYYEAIQAGDYRRAYEMWADGGTASGQSYEEFAAGFAETAVVRPGIGRHGPIRGAAGSRYVEVPVVVNATLRSGAAQRFEGSYTLRRSVVDGATAEQRSWHIYSASLTEQ